MFRTILRKAFPGGYYSRAFSLQNARRSNSNNFGSEVEGPKEIYTDVEKSYTEWPWVERLLPPKVVPSPPTVGSFPSGWKPPNFATNNNIPYLIRRNKNHMIPCYLKLYNRGQIRETRIRRIEGNIWVFEKEIGKHLKELYPEKVIMTYTNEVRRCVGIRGDFVDIVKEFIANKGF